MPSRAPASSLLPPPTTARPDHARGGRRRRRVVLVIDVVELARRRRVPRPRRGGGVPRTSPPPLLPTVPRGRRGNDRPRALRRRGRRRRRWRRGAGVRLVIPGDDGRAGGLPFGREGGHSGRGVLLPTGVRRGRHPLVGTPSRRSRRRCSTARAGSNFTTSSSRRVPDTPRSACASRLRTTRRMRTQTP